MAAKGFFVFSEAGPGMIGVVGGGDAPEIEGVGAGGFGVDNHLDEEDGAGDEFAVFGVGGGVGVVADACIVVNQRSGDGMAFILGDIEGGEAGGKLVFEVVFVLRSETVAVANGFEEGSKDGDFGRVLSSAKREAFLSVVTPETAFFFFHLGEDLGFGLSEVENPSVGGVEVVGFFEAERFEDINGEGESGFDADEEGVLLLCEVFEGGEGGLKIVGGFEGGTIGAIEIIAERSGHKDGEGVEVGIGEPEGLVTFEFLIIFPK